MDQDASLIRLAVFGSPVKHSLSPRIHAQFARQAGLTVEYQAVDVCDEFLAREVQALADSGGRGCNITMPLKQKAFALANRFSERAGLARAANTLIFDSPSKWKADNTDGAGLVRDLERHTSGKLAGALIAIIGAGGATAGVLGELLEQRLETVFLFNRSEDRARELAVRFSEHGSVRARPLSGVKQAPAFDIVINATSLGHRSRTALSIEKLFAPSSLYYDLNYGQAHEGLAVWAHRKNIRCVDGLGMLVEQAAESFYLWTRFRAETGPVIDALRSDRD